MCQWNPGKIAKSSKLHTHTEIMYGVPYPSKSSKDCFFVSHKRSLLTRHLIFKDQTDQYHGEMSWITPTWSVRIWYVILRHVTLEIYSQMRWETTWVSYHPNDSCHSRAQSNKHYRNKNLTTTKLHLLISSRPDLEVSHSKLHTSRVSKEFFIHTPFGPVHFRSRSHSRTRLSNTHLSPDRTTHTSFRDNSDPCVKDRHTFLQAFPDTVRDLGAHRKPSSTSLPHDPASICTGTHWFTSNFNDRRPCTRYTFQTSSSLRQKISKHKRNLLCTFPSLGPVHTRTYPDFADRPYTSLSPSSRERGGLRHISQGKAFTPFRHVRAPLLGQILPRKVVNIVQNVLVLSLFHVGRYEYRDSLQQHHLPNENHSAARVTILSIRGLWANHLDYGLSSSFSV